MTKGFAMDRRTLMKAAALGLVGGVLGRGAAAATPCPPSLEGGSAACGKSSADAPAWAKQAIANGWAVGQWLAISGNNPTPGYGLTATNRMIDAATGGDNVIDLTNAVLDSWTGMALCGSHRASGSLAFGPIGNHNSQGGQYFGAVLLFDIATRRWEEVAPPNRSGLSENQFGEYRDGAPVGNHNTSWPNWDPHRNEFMHPRGWGSPSSGSDQYPSKYGHGLNLATCDASGYSPSCWRRYPEMPISGSFGASANGELRHLYQGTCQWDPNRKGFWVFGSSNSIASSILLFYDSVRNAWTRYDDIVSDGNLGERMTMAIDPVRNVGVLSGATLEVFDLSNPNNRTSNRGFWTATVTGTVPPFNGRAGEALTWSSASNAFFYKASSGDAVYKLSYVSGGASNYVLRGELITTGGETPGTFTTGIFNKFQVKDYGSVVIGFQAPNVSDGPVYAFRAA